MPRTRFAFAFLALVACATDSTPDPAADPAGGDLGLGDVEDDGKADGGDPTWGHALECKALPELAPLVAPKITLSIDGLTLHLTDPATGFDKVYPVGPGKIDDNPADREYRESLSYYPILKTGSKDFAITPETIQPCKTWWTDPATGEKSPVFAGLPFLSWYGNYAIHGPIDNFRAANGGTLRRGYVSHGCFRMQAADILEVYALIKGVARVPVHVQREAEKRSDGETVDLDKKWVGASCDADSDCNYAGGFCAPNELTGKGFCSARCTSYCSDRTGGVPTFCVDDPADPSKGMCVPKANATDFECRPFDHMAVAPAQARHGQPTVTADVCMPGSRGFTGDHCLLDTDCDFGTTCKGATDTTPGICSADCTSTCADQPGWGMTFCAAVPELDDGGTCVRRCTPESNGSECPSDMVCGQAPRFGQSSTVRYVCLPKK